MRKFVNLFDTTGFLNNKVTGLHWEQTGQDLRGNNSFHFSRGMSLWNWKGKDCILRSILVRKILWRNNALSFAVPDLVEKYWLSLEHWFDEQKQCILKLHLTLYVFIEDSSTLSHSSKNSQQSYNHRGRTQHRWLRRSENFIEVFVHLSSVPPASRKLSLIRFQLSRSSVENYLCISPSTTKTHLNRMIRE